MQTNSSSFGLEQVLFELAKYVGWGGLVSFATWLTLRKKVKPEIQQIEAVTAKTYAEARHLNGETLGSAYERIEELYIIADSQRTQIGRLQLSLDKAIMNEEFLEEEVKWLNSVLHTAGVDLKKYGHMRQRQTLTAETPADDPKSS